MEPELTDEGLTAEQRRQRALRVSDAEREHVVELLQRAIGNGMLTLDEFTERTDTALAARTRGELNAVLVDLPGLEHHDAVTPATPGRTASASGSRGAATSHERTELRAHGSPLIRKGRWFVPAELLVHNKYGDTRIDFTEAEFASSVVHLELDTKWCGVRLILPRQASVDLNGLGELKWSSVRDKTDSAGRAGNPHFVMTGRLHGGSLTVRHARQGLFS